MTNYWHQRDITNRLIAARQERNPPKGDDAVDQLLDMLPAYIVTAIADALNGDEMLTQVPIDWMDE